MACSACSVPGCLCQSDFLPFTCTFCEGVFCKDHMSRFSHEPCASCCGGFVPTVSNTTKAALDAKAMIQSVSQRFVSMDDGSGGNGSLKTHGAAIRTAAIPGELLPSAGTMSRLDQLSHVSKNTTSAQTRKISNKTKEILLKSTSIGNASLAGEDRLYLSIHFLGETSAATTEGSSSSSSSGNGSGSSSDAIDADATGAKPIGFFFKKSLSLGEVLYQTGISFPQLCYGSATAPEGKALAMSSIDTPDWTSWDRSLPIDRLLVNFEDVRLQVITVEQAVSAQRDLEDLKVRLKQAEEELKEAARLQEEMEATEKLASEGEADILKHPLTKQEVVHYFSKGSPGTETVTVVGVHLDDFPNVYYTVRFNSDDGGPPREKQTDHFHLRRTAFSAGGSGVSTAPGVQRLVAEGGVQGNPLHLKINHGGKIYELGEGIGDRNTVGALKELVCRYSDVPVKSQKLVYKGMVLKDAAQDLKGAKLANGSKITLIGTPAR